MQVVESGARQNDMTSLISIKFYDNDKPLIELISNNRRPSDYIPSVVNKRWLYAPISVVLVFSTVLMVFIGYKYGDVGISEDGLNFSILMLTLFEMGVQFYINFNQSVILSNEFSSNDHYEMMTYSVLSISLTLLVLSAYFSPAGVTWTALELVRTLMKTVLAFLISRMVFSNSINIEAAMSYIGFQGSGRRDLTQWQEEINRSIALMEKVTPSFSKLKMMEIFSVYVNMAIVIPTLCFIYFTSWGFINRFTILFNIIQMTYIMFITSSKSLAYDKTIKEHEQNTFMKTDLRLILITNYIPNNETLIAPIVSLIGVAATVTFHERRF